MVLHHASPVISIGTLYRQLRISTTIALLKMLDTANCCNSCSAYCTVPPMIVSRIYLIIFSIER